MSHNNILNIVILVQQSVFALGSNSIAAGVLGEAI